MGIIDFNGKTYVAFIDISGFKNMMKDENRITEVVYHFYNSGYNILNEYRNRYINDPPVIQGIFISDCGILFVNKDHEEADLMEKCESLNQLLSVVKRMNVQMININEMLTTSIAYGSLTCSDKLEFQGISKNPFYGDAYLAAFMDQEDRQKKIQPGECRIVSKTLPAGLIAEGNRLNYENISFLRQKRDNKSHYYYYWMVKNKSKITEFNKNYSNLETERYKIMTELIKKYVQSSN